MQKKVGDPVPNMEDIRRLPPCLERDAVRLDGLRRRAELNDCHGLVRAKHGKDLYEVLVGRESFLVVSANLNFVGEIGISRTDEVTDLHTALRRGLVLDDDLYAVYTKK